MSRTHRLPPSTVVHSVLVLALLVLGTAATRADDGPQNRYVRQSTMAFEPTAGTAVADPGVVALGVPGVPILGGEAQPVDRLIRPAGAANQVLPAALGSPARQGVVQQLARHGRFARVEAGETVELAALRLGEDPDTVRRLNRVEPGHAFDEGDLLCLERRHRCLPDETVEFLAQVYRQPVDELRVLNGLAEGEQPAPWSKVLVPCPVRRRAVGGIEGEAFTISILQPLSNLFEKDGVIRMGGQAVHLHPVEEGETWARLAERFHCTVDELQRANRPRAAAMVMLDDGQIVHSQEPEPLPEPKVGQPVSVAAVLEFDESKDLLDRVLGIERTVGCDLDQVLAMNGLERPQQLAGRDSVLIPLGNPTMGVFPGGGVFMVQGAANFVVQGGVAALDVVNVFDPQQAGAGVEIEVPQGAMIPGEVVDRLRVLPPNAWVEAVPLPDGVEFPAAGVRIERAAPLGAAEAFGAPDEDQVGDYRVARTTLPRQFLDLVARGDGGGSMLAGLLGGAVLDRRQEDESLADLAARVGLDLPILLALNPGLEDAEPGTPRPVCVDLRHRVLPGEELAFLAMLHACDEAVLRALNELAEGDQPAVWSALRVPGGMSLDERGIHVRRIRRAPREGGRAVPWDRLSSRERLVAEGDTLQSLSEATEVEVQRLRTFNGWAEDVAPQAGQVILIDVRGETEAEATRAQIVTELEEILRVRLEDVLELNGWDSVDQMVPGQPLLLPRHSLVGTRAGRPMRKF